MLLVKALIALALVMGAAHAQGTGENLIYAVYNDVDNKTFFTLNTSNDIDDPADALMSYVNMLDPAVMPRVPPLCFGYDQTGMELNKFSPNALAYDGQARLYFSAWDIGGATAPNARLCLLSTVTPTFALIGALQTTGVTSAGFNQDSYVYVYFENRTPVLNMDVVFLDKITGNIVGIAEINVFADRTSDPLNTALTSIPVIYNGGDMAIDCNENLYASSVGGVGGSLSIYFKINQISVTPPAFSYEEIARGTINDDSAQLYATNSQLAYTGDGILVAHHAPSGFTSVVPDPNDGLTGYLGTENVTYVVFRNSAGEPIGFSDLASYQVCNEVLCTSSEVFSDCSQRVRTIWTPALTGVPCRLVDVPCANPPLCVEEDRCQIYLPF